MASNSEAEFKRHYTQVCHCEWSEDEFTRQTTSENCVMHGNVPDPLAALLAERQQVDAALDSLETILFGDCQQRSRDELDMRAQELVAERQQDKERIERLETALRGTNALAAAILSHRGHASIEMCLEEVLANATAIQTFAAAALAVEEETNG